MDLEMQGSAQHRIPARMLQNSNFPRLTWPLSSGSSVFCKMKGGFRHASNTQITIVTTMAIIQGVP